MSVAEVVTERSGGNPAVPIRFTSYRSDFIVLYCETWYNSGIVIKFFVDKIERKIEAKKAEYDALISELPESYSDEDIRMLSDSFNKNLLGAITVERGLRKAIALRN